MPGYVGVYLLVEVGGSGKEGYSQAYGPLGNLRKAWNHMDDPGADGGFGKSLVFQYEVHEQVATMDGGNHGRWQDCEATPSTQVGDGDVVQFDPIDSKSHGVFGAY